MGAVGSGLGGAGGAFAQSFANTLIQGHQVMTAIADRREHLDLQKKLAGAQLQEHDAKTALATRALKGVTDLQARLTPQSWPDSELGAGGATTPAPLSEPERLQYALQIDPHSAAKSMLDPKQDTRALFTALMRGDESPLASFGGQPKAAGGVEQVSGPSGDRTAPAPSGDLGPQRKADKTLTIDSDGKLSLKIGDRNVQYKMEHVTAVNPADGKPWVYRIITDPEDPQRTRTFPMAPAPPPAEMMKYDAMATSLGLKAGGALHESAVADIVYAATALQGKTQEQAFVAIEQKYRQLAADPKLNPPVVPLGPGGKGGGPGGAFKPTVDAAYPNAGAGLAATATAAANVQEVAQAAAKAEAEARARLNVPEKASPAERDKLSGQMSGTDLYGQIRALYKPEMVGPFKGGPSARFREVSGSMSQQEQQFRTAVTTANNQMIKDITGAQMSEPEAQRLMRQMPDPTLPSSQFEARLKQTQINQKIIAIRRRQVMEGTGVDMKGVPQITLTTEERRSVIAPIGQDYSMGQITREDAVAQLRGLAGYSDQGAHAFLTAIKGGVR